MNYLSMSMHTVFSSAQKCVCKCWLDSYYAPFDHMTTSLLSHDLFLFLCSLQALDGFLMVVSRDGRVLFSSESIANYLGLRQVSGSQGEEGGREGGGEGDRGGEGRGGTPTHASSISSQVLCSHLLTLFVHNRTIGHNRFSGFMIRYSLGHALNTALLVYEAVTTKHTQISVTCEHIMHTYACTRTTYTRANTCTY